LPGLGSYPISAWQPEAIFCDIVQVALAADSPAPGVYQVEVGLIDEHTQERLPAYDLDGTPLTTNFVDRIKIAPAAYVTPPIEHPLNYRLGDQIALIGYDLDRSAAKPGEAVHLRLYWQALQRLSADYAVFAQCVLSTIKSWRRKTVRRNPALVIRRSWEAGEEGDRRSGD
jgi:hypothetical protein